MMNCRLFASKWSWHNQDPGICEEKLQNIMKNHRQDSYSPNIQTKHLPHTSLEYLQQAKLLSCISYIPRLMHHETMLPTEIIIVFKINKP